MREQRRFPKYLDAPMILIWFESDTFGIGLATFLLGSFVHWAFFPVGFYATYKYAQSKKYLTRGYFKQIGYFLGLKKIDGYPDYFTRRFNE